MAQSTYRHWRPLGLAVCAIFLSFCAWDASAARTEDIQTIAAIVNDDVISDYDLQQRTRLLERATNNANPSADLMAQIRQEALKSLIDERLELQEAKRLGIKVEPAEIDRGMSRLAQHNNMTYDQMKDFFTASGVDLATLRSQVVAQITWSRLVTKKFLGRINVSDAQINSAMQDMKRKAGQPERRIAEIVLPVDSPAQDNDVRQTAQRLVEEIRGGAQFNAVAHQYSQSGTAARGGDVGWVAAGQLPSALETVLDRMSPGDISDPIPFNGTYTIIGFIQQRSGGGDSDSGGDGGGSSGGGGGGGATTYMLRQLVIPVDANRPGARDAALARAEQLRQQLKSCADMTSTPEAGNPLSGDLGTVAAKDLPAAFQAVLAGLDTGQVARPFESPDGVHVLMVCGKQGANSTETAAAAAPKSPTAMPSRDDVEEQLTDEQLEMMARRYLRDLRRDALIEYRVAEH